MISYYDIMKRSDYLRSPNINILENLSVMMKTVNPHNAGIQEVCNQLMKAYCEKYYDSSNSKELKEKIIEYVIPSSPSFVEMRRILKETQNNIDTSPFIEKMNKYRSCDRVIENGNVISKRYNFDNIARLSESTTDKVQMMCELMDTYSKFTRDQKLAIAIENIPYTLSKNGIKYENALSDILDYFLLSESVISDAEYKKLIEAIKRYEFDILGNKNDLSIMNEKNHIYFSDMIAYIAEWNTTISKGNLHDVFMELMNVKTEKDVYDYIQYSTNILNDGLSSYEKDILLKTYDFIPLITDVDKEYVSLKVSNTNVVNEYNPKSMIESADIITEMYEAAKKEYVDNRNPIEIVAANAAERFNTSIKRIFESVDMAESKDIKDLLTQFKLDQNKSPNKLKNLFTKLLAKSPENIIDEMPSILSLVRGLILLTIATVTPIGPILAALTYLICRIIKYKLDYDQADKLLKAIKAERDKVEKEIQKSSKDTDKLEEYKKCLDKCYDKVKAFKDKIQEDDDDDEFDFDLDIEFEQALSILESASNLCDNDIYERLYSLVQEATSYEDIISITEAVYNCPSIDINKYINIIKEDDKYNVVMDLTESRLELMKIDNHHNNTNQAIIEMGVSNIIINEAKINDFKLAMLNFKKKFKELSAKEKQMWKNIDILSSQLYQSVQKSMTTDRREAIIKGNVIPSMSKILKTMMAIGAAGGASLVAGMGALPGAAIAVVGILGTSKILNEKEKRLIYDEIETELQVVEKQIELAQNDGDMNQYRFLLNYQKRLARERQRIRYGLQSKGRSIPGINLKSDD